MATLLEIYQLRYQSANIRDRVTAAVAKAAQDILAEDPGTENHAARLTWAKNALVNTASEAERFLWAVCGNATIQAAGEAATDNDIQYVVNGNINTFAV